MDKMTYLSDERRKLEKKEEFLVKCIARINDQCNRLHIEKLHLQSQKSELRSRREKKKPEAKLPSAPQPETLPDEQAVTPMELDIFNEQVNQREIDLSITDTLSSILPAVDVESDEDLDSDKSQDGAVRRLKTPP